MANANTKSKKTTPVTDPIEEAEKALAEARDLLAAREQAARDAVEAEKKLKAQLHQGDASITAEDMMRAQFEVERTAGLVNAAKVEIDKAKKNLAATIAEHEPIVAEWVAEAIKANGWGWGLYGIPVYIGKPGKDAPEPSVWLSQEAPAEMLIDSIPRIPSGHVSATVNLVVVTPGGVPIGDAVPIMTAAQKLAQDAGGEVNASAGNHPQGSTVRLQFRRVLAGLPVLPGKLRDPKDAHEALLNAIIKAGPWEWRRVREIGPEDRVPVLSGYVDRAELVETHQDGRIVTRTFDGLIRIGGSLQQLVNRVAEQVIGTDTPAGRIIGVEIDRCEVQEVDRNGMPATRTMVDVRIRTRFRLVR